MNKTESLAILASTVILAASCVSHPQINAETNVAVWEREAKNVVVIRDNWGVPHVYGKTDADAVFGVIYAQAEDYFNRVERVVERADAREDLPQQVRPPVSGDNDGVARRGHGSDNVTPTRLQTDCLAYRPQAIDFTRIY